MLFIAKIIAIAVPIEPIDIRLFKIQPRLDLVVLIAEANRLEEILFGFVVANELIDEFLWIIQLCIFKIRVNVSYIQPCPKTFFDSFLGNRAGILITFFVEIALDVLVDPFGHRLAVAHCSSIPNADRVSSQ